MHCTGGTRGTGTLPDPLTMSLGWSGGLICGFCPPNALCKRKHGNLTLLLLTSLDFPDKHLKDQINFISFYYGVPRSAFLLVPSVLSQF